MRDLTRGKEGKEIFLFALPMLIGSLFQQLYNTADSIIVGRFIGKDAMAAVSSTTPIMFLLMSFSMGITLGFSVIISQNYGSKNFENVKRTIDTTYIFLIVSSLIVSVIGALFSKRILMLTNTPQSIIDQSTKYLIIIFVGSIFSAGYNSICAILRGVGDSTTPLLFLIIASILNIILDVVFIINFKLGVSGVALATIISQGVSFLFSLVYLNKKHEMLRFRFKELTYNHDIMKKGLKLGIPSAAQQMLFSVGNMALQSLVNGYGTATMAAFGAGSKIESFISIPIINLGSAVSTFVAQNVGAQRIDRVKKGVLATIKIASIISVIVTMVFVIFSKELISLFNTDKEVIKIGSEYLVIIGPLFVIVSISFMLTSAIRGAGDSMFPLLSSMVSFWLVRIPASYLLSNLFGINGVWMGIPVGWIIGFIINMYYYIKGPWKEKAVIPKMVEQDI